MSYRDNGQAPRPRMNVEPQLKSALIDSVALHSVNVARAMRRQTFGIAPTLRAIDTVGLKGEVRAAQQPRLRLGELIGQHIPLLAISAETPAVRKNRRVRRAIDGYRGVPVWPMGVRHDFPTTGLPYDEVPRPHELHLGRRGAIFAGQPYEIAGVVQPAAQLPLDEMSVAELNLTRQGLERLTQRYELEI